MAPQQNKIPRYKQIENDLINMINNGVYVADDMLPTEAELSKEYNVSRVTVRQALGNLAAKGYIYRNQGSGSFVAKTQAVTKTPLIKGFSKDMREMGKVPSSIVNTFSVTTAGKTVARILGCKPDDRIYYIERTRLADGVPMMFERTYMSVDMHPEMSIKILESSKYEYAEKNHFDIDYDYQNVTAIFPPEYIAEILHCDPKMPMLKIANTVYLKDGKIFNFDELYLQPEFYQLNIIKRRQ